MSHPSTEMALDSLTGWWGDMGVDIDDAVISALKNATITAAPPNALPASQSSPVPAKSGRRRRKTLEDWVAEAESLARACDTLDALKTAIEGFEGCPLKEAANKTVVFDGVQGAPVMVIGEGAGGREDRIGLPFVGKAGELLDKMLTSIGMDRKTNTFITNVTYWRPPGNRNPSADELAVCRPFVDRMIELNAPKIILAVGGVSAKSLLASKTGIMKLRGHWVDYTTPHGFTSPMLPTFHPAYLLRRAEDKSRAWRDLLEVQARLEQETS
ncbi:MAG: uracil-DNA glycosylase [Hyphomonadaceae bacterium]